MKVRCIRCSVNKELTPEELKESGEFVQTRKLGAVGFLKVLSLDMRSPCTNGKNHEYEYESGFDEEIHKLAADIKSAKNVVVNCEKEVEETEKIIQELIAKVEISKQKRLENYDKSAELLEKMQEIAWIDDEKLWT